MISVPQLRIRAQKLQGSAFKSVKEVVAHMGAMQAQDFAMALWALGVRTANPTKPDVENAFDKGEILRTHLMRPTWHFVAADDIYWMLELTAPQIKIAARTRYIFWGFNEDILRRAFDRIQNVLAGGQAKTREELMLDLQQAGINTDEGRSYHLMLWAELEQVVCSGPLKGKEHTYTLLEERVPQKNILSKEEALYKLALRFFTSHAPATLADFVWWSGLKTTDARKALQSIEKEMETFQHNGVLHYFPKDSQSITSTPHALFLPAFDEYVIAYKDRSLILNPDWGKYAISNNGVFKPIIVLDGQVVGIWKRSFKKESVVVEPELFKSLNASEQKLLEQAAGKYAAYEGKSLIYKK
jgi:hypothetical protein